MLPSARRSMPKPGQTDISKPEGDAREVAAPRRRVRKGSASKSPEPVAGTGLGRDGHPAGIATSGAGSAFSWGGSEPQRSGAGPLVPRATEPQRAPQCRAGREVTDRAPAACTDEHLALLLATTRGILDGDERATAAAVSLGMRRSGFDLRRTGHGTVRENLCTAEQQAGAVELAQGSWASRDVGAGLAAEPRLLAK